MLFCLPCDDEEKIKIKIKLERYSMMTRVLTQHTHKHTDWTMLLLWTEQGHSFSLTQLLHSLVNSNFLLNSLSFFLSLSLSLFLSFSLSSHTM